MRAVAVAVAAVLLAVLATSVAEAKPRLKPVVPGPAAVAVLPDGLVGVSVPNKPFLLLNEATGAVSSVPLPSLCSLTFRYQYPQLFIAFRFPELLLDCGWPPKLLNVETGEATAIPMPPNDVFASSCQDDGPRFTDVGRYWVQGVCGVHSATYAQFYVNRRTGEFRPGGFFDYGDPTAPPFYDMDSPGLDVSDGFRCSGLSGAYFSRPKWVVYRTKKSPKLRLRRCRGGKSIVLSDRNDTAGITRKRAAAWVEGSKVGLYMVDSGRRYRWNVPRYDPSRGGTWIELSDRYLYVQVPATRDGYSVYRAALPKRVAAARSASR